MPRLTAHSETAMQITPIEAAAVVAIALATLRLQSIDHGDNHGPLAAPEIRSTPNSDGGLLAKTDPVLARIRAGK